MQSGQKLHFAKTDASHSFNSLGDNSKKMVHAFRKYTAKKGVSSSAEVKSTPNISKGKDTGRGL